jgi:hypothetical protein
MKKFLQWLLFLPVGYFLFYIGRFLVFMGLSFFFFWTRDLGIIWAIIISLILTTPILVLTIIIFGGTASGASYLSPNRTAYWLLATAYLILNFRSVFSYCSVGSIPENAAEIIIQLPCWIYGVIFLFQASVIVLIGTIKDKKDEVG